MFSQRQKDTFIYLLGATFLSAFICALFLPAPPILFGLAIVYSNKNYLKNKLSMIGVPFTFFILFFVTSGVLTSKMDVGRTLGICYLTFYAIAITPKIVLKNIQIGLIQILLFALLPIISLFIISLITNLHFGQLNNADLPLMVFIYQLSMTIIITSMVKQEVITEQNDLIDEDSSI